MSELWNIITSTDPEVRNRSLNTFCRKATTEQLLAELSQLEKHRHNSENLYERVRALFFLYAIHRFHLPQRLERNNSRALIPFDGFEKLLSRRYEEAISIFLSTQATTGMSDGISKT